MEKALESDSLFTEEVQDFGWSLEKGGEPKVLQPENHAVGGEAVVSQLGDKEKENDPVADPLELTGRC